jgi:hypothetical protein
MSQELKLIALAQAMGGDVKTLTNRVGDMTSLQTTAKGNLVAAINELMSLMGSSGAVIDDNAGDGNTAVTWSANKIFDTIEMAKAAVKTDILGGATAAYDTLKELQDLIVNDESIVSALATKVGEKVSFAEVQTLTTGQRLQACTNIGIGDPEADLVAAYTAAKA